MLKDLWLLVVVALSGCIVYVDSVPHDTTTTSSWGVWVADPYVECEPPLYWGESEWYLEVYAGSYHTDIAHVTVYIGAYEHTTLNYAGDTLWVRGFVTDSYACEDVYSFEFIATDLEGYEAYKTIHW